jgi:electron transport complex protein RnfB
VNDATERLARALDAALPQTQCTRCGYPDCRSYAQAIAQGAAGIHQCPPGGAEGIARLAALTGLPLRPLDPTCGTEGPRLLAVINEPGCIGCTLCLKACPVDCIIGGPKAMHTVIEAQCTGCELCVPACPVDCIALVPASGTRTGWQAWSADQALHARARHDWHRDRLQRDAAEQQRRLAASAVDRDASAADGTPVEPTTKAGIIASALNRARAARRP